MFSRCRNYGSLPNTDSQQTRLIKNRRGRKLYRWRVDKLEVNKNSKSSNENAVQLSELLENIGTTKDDIERDNAGTRIIEG